jgi:hypothetical protein
VGVTLKLDPNEHLYRLTAGIDGGDAEFKTRTAQVVSFFIGTLGGLVGFSPSSRIGVALWGFQYTTRGARMAVSVFILSLGIAHGIATILALKQRPADWHGNFSSQWRQLRQVVDKCSLGFCVVGLGWITFNRLTGDIPTGLFVVLGSTFVLIALFLSGVLPGAKPTS